MVLREADIIISTLNYSGNQIMDCLTVEKNGGNCIVNIIIVDEVKIPFINSSNFKMVF
jgi:hypothetical protein